MAAYTGGQFPYWITITNDGVHGTVGVQSEQIPVTPAVSYQFQVICSYASSWASGMTLDLIFYNSSGSIISTFNGSQANMTGGVLYQVSTGMVAAPAGAAYAICEVVQAGLPGSALSLYQAELNDQNYSQLNINYTFTYNFWPWSPLGTGPTLQWNYSPLLSGDSDSLVLDGVIELMGGQQGVQCDIPELLDSNGQGPTFRILAPPSMNSAALGYEASYDLNAPQPTQDVVASMLLDGERPFGSRSSNRTISLPVIVFGTQAGGMAQVLRAQEYLMSVIDQQTYQLKWTSADTGLPMIFDCFRAMPSTPLYGFNYNAGGTQTGSTIGRPNYPIGMITVLMQALPYGRSDIDGVQNLAFGSPLVNGVPTQASQNIDLFTTVFNPPPVLTAPTWNQLGFANPTGQTTWNIPVGSGDNVAIGSTVVVQVETPTNVGITVTDTQGNVYALATPAYQNGSESQWVYVFTAPAQGQLSYPSDHITITAGSSTNAMSSAYSITGAWQPRPAMPRESVTSGSSFSVGIGSLNQYDMLVSITSGLGSSGVTPTNFTAIGNNNGNGFNNTMAYYCMPINQTTVTYNVASGLPNTAANLLFAFQPVNQYWVQDTTGAPAGAVNGHSAHYEPPRPMHLPWPAAVYGQTLPSPVSIVGLPVLSLWLGQAYDTQWPKDPKWQNNIVLHYTLTDSLGKTISFSKAHKNVSWGTHPTVPKWTRINAAIPQSRGFAYNSVASYTVRITNWSGSGHSGYVRMHAWLNSLVANSQTIQNGISPRGNVYNLFSLPGTARSPISVQCQQPAGSPITKELTTPVAGTGYFISPPGVYSLQAAECYAGGGAGSSTNLGRSIVGAGGGGGEWAQEANLPVTPGTKIPYVIGSGGLPGQINSTVIQFQHTGLSHWTAPANITSVLVECWGAGAAGAAGGGGGGGGGYSSKTVTVVPGTTYYIWTGVGGKADTGKTAAQNASRNGESSWFGPNGNKYASGATVAANGGVSPTTGGTGGGNGGSTAAPANGTAKFAGGRGGTSPGPSGGGGGGAGGSTQAGGAGQDSQPHLVTGSTPWQTGGLGGLGGSVGGGNGGVGAGTPGFPAVGVSPGGGGGGGYTSGTLATTVQVASSLPGTKSVNYLGANGANGMVQLTYAVNGGNPLNGGNTTFGSVALTGKQVVAHGGTSAANNSTAGPAGGTGSSNTSHNTGGAGGLINTGPQGGYMVSPAVTSVFANLANGSYNSASATSSAATASIAQGVSVVLVESTGPVTDLTITDSAGNQYQPWGGQQAGGSGAAGVTAYCWVANIEYPIVSSSTTLTITSSTSQEYGYLWLASKWLCAGVVTGNAGVGNGTGSTASGQFTTADDQSLQIELAVVVQDGSTTVSSLAQGKTWFQASPTNTQAAGTLNMSAYVMENQGGGTGGTGSAGTGDTFTAALSGSANWAVLCVPLILMNQSSALVKMDWRAGTTPGAQTTWATEAAISANGYILVVGMCGTGSSATAGPSAMADASGNHYTFQDNTVLPGNGGAMFIATAPVTAALAAGTTGTYNWGHSSAAPNYMTETYWVPNAVGIDANGVSAASGAASAVSAAYTPSSPSDMLVAVVGNTTLQTYGDTQLQWNPMDVNSQGTLIADVFAAQNIDLASQVFTGFFGSSANWATLIIGFQMALAGIGGGSAAGPGNAGYPGVWQGGAPGIPGGGAGKGGTGASTVNTNGGGAALPGGGGGGSYSNNTGVNQGGPGGQGMIRLSWTPPLTTMNNLIVHSLGAGSDPNVCPIIPIPITDAPNNTEYTVPSVTGLLPATFGSTYTVIPVAYAWNAATAGTARQITVTINQYEYPGGPRYSVQATRAVTPATDIVNGFVNLGEVTLPIKDYVKYNDQSYFTVSINDSDSGDRFMDVLFLDTTGQTVLINIDPGQAGHNQYVNYFIDEATPDRDLGFIGASFQDRQHTVSVLDSCMVSGGALYIQAGDNLMLVYSTAGAPSLQVTYAPRWYLSRSV